MLSDSFDWLVTVDPHLHRYGSLAEVSRIPTRVRSRRSLDLAMDQSASP
jgi:hypothetical protein